MRFEQITDRAQIARGDCLELLHEIPEGSVDMVLTDLPYGNTEASWDIRIDEFALFNSPLKKSFLCQNGGANYLILLRWILVKQHFSTGC